MKLRFGAGRRLRLSGSLLDGGAAVLVSPPGVRAKALFPHRQGTAADSGPATKRGK